jgi:hypothetical protein
LIVPFSNRKWNILNTLHDGDYIEIEGYEDLPPTRSYLEHVRRSSPNDATFTISRNVEVLYGKCQPISSEGKLIEYALAFANDETDRSEIKSLIQAGKVSISSKTDARNWTPEQQLVLDKNVIAATRARQREFLASVIANKNAVAIPFPVSAKKDLERVWPLLESTTGLKGGISLVVHIIIFDAKGFDAYVSVLLLDRARPFGKDLCQCRFDGCGRFFLKEHAPRKPHLVYCEKHRSGDDMRSTHNAGARVRVRIVRATRILSAQGFKKDKARPVVEQLCDSNPQLTAVRDVVKRARKILQQAREAK